MNREYEFSVVVFAKDTAKLYRTFKNVREVTPEGTVQILAVCIAGDMDIPDERDMRELEEAGEKEKELKDEELDKIYGEFNPEDPRFREMLDDRDLLYIDGLECGDLVAELKDKIAGSYVVFAKAGIRFSPKSSAEIRRCFEEENRDVVLTKIREKEISMCGSIIITVTVSQKKQRWITMYIFCISCIPLTHLPQIR